MRRFNPVVLLWLAGYLAVLVGILVALLMVRRWSLESFDTVAARRQWHTWREDVRRQATTPGPVQRRVPKSPEPPALVLMRDHFPVCTALAFVLGTALFATFMLVVRGVCGSAPPILDE